jgi:hypothetical protein
MTAEVKPIRGKVARILNSKEVALNIGQEDGVELGMVFNILDPNGYDIKDPDTGNMIGSVERPKVSVRVTHIQYGMSVASTYKTERVNIGGSSAALSIFSSLPAPRWVNRAETLKIDDKTWEHLEEEKSYVSTGDPVVQVFED